LQMDVLHARAIVFDKDGVLLDTMAMIRETWTGWALARGLDPDEVLASIHMTGYELLARFVPTADPAAEFGWIGARQAALEPSIAAFAGAAGLISSLPRDAWAVVTSARREVSIRHLGIAGLPVPDVLIAAEDTPRGKPDPAGYRLAAERLGVRANECVVVEDAPAGVRAARDAGMSVVAVTTTHTADELREAGAIIESLTQLEVAVADGDLAVRIRPSA
jgi:mannitol-1-/sugar-/sorbitol-6-phosphatase